METELQEKFEALKLQFDALRAEMGHSAPAKPAKKMSLEEYRKKAGLTTKTMSLEEYHALAAADKIAVVEKHIADGGTFSDETPKIPRADFLTLDVDSQVAFIQSGGILTEQVADH